MEDKHFDKVFYFICGVVLLVFIFDCLIVLVPLQPVGQKYADNLVGALNTGALMACIAYLLGGNPGKKTDTAVTGNNTVVNATTEPAK